MTNLAPARAGSASPCSHVVQLHDADDRVLIATAGSFLAAGVLGGDCAVVIAGAERGAKIADAMRAAGCDLDTATSEGRFVLLDAHATLALLLVQGQPDAARFDEVVAGLVRTVRGRGRGGLRAYGEMVGILWEAERYVAAIRLEDLWNALLEAERFELFCAYPIDVFGESFRVADVDAVLSTHTHMVPAGNAAMQSCVDRAMEEVLGRRADGVRRLRGDDRPAWGTLPDTEATILWLRTNLPNYADEILTRARRYYAVTAA